MSGPLNGIPTSAQGQSALDWFFGIPDTGVQTTMSSGSVIYDTGDQLPSILPPESPLPPSYQVGTPSAGIWRRMPDDEQASIGDRLRFTYRLKLPFLEDWQTGALTSKLSKDDRFELHFIGVNEENSKVRIEATIRKPMTPAILIAGAVLAVAIGIGVWLATESVEKLVTVQNPFSTDPNSKVNLFPLFAIAALGIAALYYAPRLLKSGAG